MPESKVPFRTAPVTASDGIHETLVTDDSTRIFGSSPATVRVREYVRTAVAGEGAGHPAGWMAADPGTGGQHPRPREPAHLVGMAPTPWNGGSWGTDRSTA